MLGSGAQNFKMGGRIFLIKPEVSDYLQEQVESAIREDRRVTVR